MRGGGLPKVVKGGRERAEATGRRAEWLVAWRYRLAGYRVIAARFRCRGGEIDLVAHRKVGGDDLLAFIEVKARARVEDAINAVTPRARRRIESAGRQFIAANAHFADARIRYDIAAVSGWRVHRLIDAWRA